MEIQKRRMAEWNVRRRKLVEGQADRLQITVSRREREREKESFQMKISQLKNELSHLDSEEEHLFFFENRLRLEKEAMENEEISQEAAAVAK